MRRNRRCIVALLVGIAAAVASPRALAGPVCPWDLDGDNLVGITDLLDLLAQWGTNPGGPPDFDNDGSVGITDLLALLANWGPCPGAGPCGAKGSGSCYSAHAGPACEDFACCNSVCGLDPDCCTLGWDQACADLAAQTCGDCGDPAAGNCCEPDTTPGCDDAACCGAVCAIDTFCCDGAWDELCVQHAEKVCAICGP